MALDLSQLPAPKVLQTIDFETLLLQVITFFRDLDPDYIDVIESDPAYNLLEAIAYVASFLKAEINTAAAAVLITHSTGTDLDNLAALWSLTRQTGESDANFQERTANYLEALIPGSNAWYNHNAIQVEVTEVPGIDNLIDGTPTPIDVSIIDSQTIQTPNPSYNPSQPKSETNLETIPGSLNLYVQSQAWTDPRTTPDLLHELIPSAEMIQAVKNYLDVEGTTATGTAKMESLTRRFLNDTVYVLPTTPKPFVICAELSIKSSLNASTELEKIQGEARIFVDANLKIKQEIPISSIYRTIQTDEVNAFRLIYPTADIIPLDGETPVCYPDQELKVAEYHTFTSIATILAESDEVWTLGDARLLASELEHATGTLTAGQFNVNNSRIRIYATDAAQDFFAGIAQDTELTISAATTDGEYTVSGTPTTGTDYVDIPVAQDTAPAPAYATGHRIRLVDSNTDATRWLLFKIEEDSQDRLILDGLTYFRRITATASGSQNPAQVWRCNETPTRNSEAYFYQVKLDTENVATTGIADGTDYTVEARDAVEILLSQ